MEWLHKIPWRLADCRTSGRRDDDDIDHSTPNLVFIYCGIHELALVVVDWSSKRFLYRNPTRPGESSAVTKSLHQDIVVEELQKLTIIIGSENVPCSSSTIMSS